MSHGPDLRLRLTRRGYRTRARLALCAYTSDLTTPGSN
jgi:hypothetical protein